MNKLFHSILCLIIVIVLLTGTVICDKKTSVDNVAPQISFEVKPKKPVDVIILTDYTGQALADIQSSANSMKSNLTPKNFDVNVNFMQNTVKAGTVLDYLRYYYRYAHFTYKWDHIQWWSPVSGGDLYNEIYTSSPLVETQQAYETQENTLPSRAGANVTGYSSNGGHSTTTTDYTDIRLSLAGDIIPFVDTSYSDYYQSKDGSSGRIFEGWHFVSYGVDRSFTPGGVISTKVNDLIILDADKLATIPLRSGSIRYLVIATNNVYNTGNFTTTLQNYIKNNNIIVKASINDIAHDWLITQENYIKRAYVCTKEIYYFTRTGRMLRTGADSGSEYYVDVTDQFPGVDRVEEQEGTIFFYSGKNILYVKNIAGVIVSFPFPNALDFKYYISPNSSVPSYAFVLNNDKKLYDYYPDSGSYVLLANRIDTLPTNANYDTTYRRLNVLYSPTQFYGISKIDGGYVYAYNADGSTLVYYRSTYCNGQLAISNIKQTQHYSYDSNYIYDFILTTDNKLYCFSMGRYDYSLTPTLLKTNITVMPSNSNFDYFAKTFSGALIPLPTLGVYKNVYPVSNYSTFYENTNGTVAYIGISYAYYTIGHSHGEGYYIYTLVPTGVVNTGINGIKKIATYYYNGNTSYYPYMRYSQTYILDNSGVLWSYQDGYNLETSTVCSLYQMKTGVQDFVLTRNSANANATMDIYTLQTNGTVYKNINADTGITGITSITSCYTDPRNAGAPGTVIAINSNGDAYGVGNSAHWQLGQATSTTTWVKPLRSRVTVSNPALPYVRMDDLVRANPHNTYYPQGQGTNAINDISSELTYDTGTKQSYVVVGDPLSFKTVYSDYENDPEKERRWVIIHTPDYFENPMGLAPNSGKAMPSPPTSFTKSGKYDIELQTRDLAKNDTKFDNYNLWSTIAKATVYAHRLGVPQFRMAITPNGNGLFHVTAIEAGSYDLDHYSQPNHGIVAWDWRWKEETEASWHNERMDTNCDPSKRYLVQLRVKDMDGFWSDYKAIDIDTDNPPVALYSIDKNPISVVENAKIKDLSFVQSFSSLKSWHWIVKKLNSDGTVPSTNIQNATFTNSNAGAGGYDVNVKTSYTDTKDGTYRIYLRVKDTNGLWSDGGTDDSANINNMYYQDLVVEEGYKLSNLRIVRVRDLHLDSFYKDSISGKYIDRPMGVNTMAVDAANFLGMVDGLTKGYMFEFEIDSANFNENTDTIVITPHFFTCDSFSRDGQERELYWENSSHRIIKAGEGGHSRWATVILTRIDRKLTNGNNATWRGQYLIPGTAWAVPMGTKASEAVNRRINRDIIVSFEIKGYKNGVQAYNYNTQSWAAERTLTKHPYALGDVIRYSHSKSNLDDITTVRNRP